MNFHHLKSLGTSPVTQGPWHHPGLHILDALTESALVLEQHERILHLNQAAERLLRIDCKVKGQPLDQVATLRHGSSQRPIQLDLRKSPTPGFTGEFDLLVRNDGSSLPVEISVSTLAPQAPDHLLLLIRDASAMQDYINQLTYCTSHDEQTRLLRRSELIRRLTRLLQDKTSRDTHAFLLLDINHFKALNDCAGHAAGDAAICHVAARLQSVIRGRDTLARMGGDEFGVLMEHCPEAQARNCAKLLQDAVASHPLTWDGQDYPLSVSVGLTYLKDARHTVYGVLQSAGMDCHQAKRQLNLFATS